MYSDALRSAIRRGDQFGYVTRHFRDLQGLRYVPLWAAWLVLSVFAEATQLPERRFVEINMLIVVAFCAAWLPWIIRWYRLHYGTVTEGPSRSDTLRMYLFMCFLLALPASLFIHSLDRYQAYGYLWPVFIFVLPSGLHLPPANLPIRVRFLVYLAAGLALLLLIGCAPVLHLSVWRVQASFSGTLLVVSLYDHWLLSRLLNGTHGSFL